MRIIQKSCEVCIIIGTEVEDRLSLHRVTHINIWFLNWWILISIIRIKESPSSSVSLHITEDFGISTVYIYCVGAWFRNSNEIFEHKYLATTLDSIESDRAPCFWDREIDTWPPSLLEGDDIILIILHKETGFSHRIHHSRGREITPLYIIELSKKLVLRRIVWECIRIRLLGHRIKEWIETNSIIEKLTRFPLIDERSGTKVNLNSIRWKWYFTPLSHSCIETFFDEIHVSDTDIIGTFLFFWFFHDWIWDDISIGRSEKEKPRPYDEEEWDKRRYQNELCLGEYHNWGGWYKVFTTMQRVYSAFLVEVLPLISFGIGRRFFGQNHGGGRMREASKAHWDMIFPSKSVGFPGRSRCLSFSHISSRHRRETDHCWPPGAWPEMTVLSIFKTRSARIPSSGLGTICAAHCRNAR